MQILPIFSALFLLFATPALANPGLPAVSPGKAGLSAERLARGRTIARQYVADGKYAGVIGLVARKGQVVDFWAEGQRDREQQKPMEKDTIVRIYSMTKIVTSVAVMMLVEEGKIVLDDPIEKYLPGLGKRQILQGGTEERPILVDAKKPITVFHLLTHTAGMPYGKLGGTLLGRLYHSAHLDDARDLNDFVARLSTLPIGHEPGTKFTYGVNTDVLGRLVEVVSGTPFQDFLSQRIFVPLGMVDTGFWVPDNKRERMAVIYETGEDGKLRPKADPMWPKLCIPGDHCMASGGAGLYSTISDYFRFAQMLLDGGVFRGKRLLARQTVMRMASDHLRSMGIAGLPWESVTGFGLGVSVRELYGPAQIAWPVGSFGWDGAGSTYCRIDPRSGMVTLFFIQHMPMDPSNLVPRLVNIVEGAMEAN
jgi:CubicO group peptidase (beta-lactamase class C family)